MWPTGRGHTMGHPDEGSQYPLRLGGMVPQRFVADMMNGRGQFGGGAAADGGGEGGGEEIHQRHLLTPMEFRAAVNAVASRYIKNIDASEMLKTKRMFLEWKSEPDKLDVMHMYRHSGWRAIYTQNLFLPRIQTVEFSVQRLLDIPAPRSVLTKATRYVSLGCGPGPCVSAVMMVLRRDLLVGHELAFTGVDQFIGWKPYIESLNSVDAHSRVAFQQLKVGETTVNHLPVGEVAIMSYTDAAVHTPTFWEGLRARYSLIIILDQNKSALSGLLRRQEFRMVEYQLKGHKRFYYQVSRRKMLKSTAPANGEAASSAEFKYQTETGKPVEVIPPLSQMRELKQVEQNMNTTPITKTKCGTESGKYSGALEPQKRMTTDRLNQLLRAKLLALEDTASSPEPETASVSEAISSNSSPTRNSSEQSEPAKEIKAETSSTQEYVIPVLSSSQRVFADDFPAEFRMNPIFKEEDESQVKDEPVVLTTKTVTKKISPVSTAKPKTVIKTEPRKKQQPQTGFDLRQVLSRRRKGTSATPATELSGYFPADAVTTQSTGNYFPIQPSVADTSGFFPIQTSTVDSQGFFPQISIANTSGYFPIQTSTTETAGYFPIHASTVNTPSYFPGRSSMSEPSNYFSGTPLSTPVSLATPAQPVFYPPILTPVENMAYYPGYPGSMPYQQPAAASQLTWQAASQHLIVDPYLTSPSPQQQPPEYISPSPNQQQLPMKRRATHGDDSPPEIKRGPRSVVPLSNGDRITESSSVSGVRDLRQMLQQRKARAK